MSDDGTLLCFARFPTKGGVLYDVSFSIESEFEKQEDDYKLSFGVWRFNPKKKYEMRLYEVDDS